MLLLFLASAHRSWIKNPSSVIICNWGYLCVPLFTIQQITDARLSKRAVRKVKTLVVFLCDDNSIVRLTDRSIMIHTGLIPAVGGEEKGNRSEMCKTANTWCLATASHTITHAAETDVALKDTRLSTTSEASTSPRIPQYSERPHTANSRMQQCCHVCRTQV